MAMSKTIFKKKMNLIYPKKNGKPSPLSKWSADELTTLATAPAQRGCFAHGPRLSAAFVLPMARRSHIGG